MDQKIMDDLLKRAERQFRGNPPSVMLSKADALEGAAKYLDANAASLSIVGALLADGKFPASAEPVVAVIRAQAIEADLQIEAMHSAARAIRELAIEERIVAARVAREGARSR